MYAPVRHQSSAIVPEHAPVTMKAVLVECSLRCRPQPHFKINSGRYRRIRNNFSADSIVKIPPDIYFPQGSDMTRLHKFHGLFKVRTAALLLPDLHHPFVFAGGFDHQITFTDTICERFFNIYILTCLAGGNEGQAMPVIRRSNDHRINIPVLQKFSEIFILLCWFALYAE